PLNEGSQPRLMALNRVAFGVGAAGVVSGTILLGATVQAEKQ
ncbi:MAG: hypothetical protein ACI8RZ_005961, partial [Myxococcota bacterium]